MSRQKQAAQRIWARIKAEDNFGRIWLKQILLFECDYSNPGVTNVGHQVAHYDHVSRPRACSKNNISMINVFRLTNINTKIIEGKLSELFISEGLYQTSSPSH